MQQTFRRLAAASVRVAHTYNTFAHTHRYTTASATAACLATVGDLFAQKVIEKREDVNWYRTLTYSSWICLVSAPMHTRLYMYWDRIWGESVIARVKKVCLDTFVVPLAYFPAFYVYKGLMNGFTLPEIGQDIRERFGITFAAECLFFLPASTLNFTVVPPHLRPSFLYCWEVGWAALFSYIGFSEEPFGTTTSTSTSTSGSAALHGSEEGTVVVVSDSARKPVMHVATTHINSINESEFGMNVTVVRKSGEEAVWREKTSSSFGQMSSLMPVMQINWR